MDLLNELQYNFGGTKAVTEAARDGNLTYDDLQPNFFQSLLGVTKADLDRARYQGDLQRFNESTLAGEAEQYGVDVAQTGTGKINRGAIRTKVDEAKDLKGLISQYRQLGGSMDTTDMTAGQVGNLIRQQTRKNTIEDATAQATAAYNLPGAVEERRRAAEQRLDLLKQQEDNLAFQRLQAQRADDRYYDRLEREDARLRREGYQSLTSGLAALAAAFAIV